MSINPELGKKRRKKRRGKENLKSNPKVRYLNSTEKEYREDERRKLFKTQETCTLKRWSTHNDSNANPTMTSEQPKK